MAPRQLALQGALFRAALLLRAVPAGAQPELRPAPGSSCPRSEQAWLAHCAFAEDCTTELAFCDCCAAHAETVYATACAAMCRGFEGRRAAASAQQPAVWSFDDFSAATPEEQLGPAFDQPALSLVGDASVVLGDCYSLNVRATENLDGSQDACLVPPVAARLFAEDSVPPTALPVCSAPLAPFHAYDPAPASLAAMLCFDECHASNDTARQPEPPRVDNAALFIANCTRGCLGRLDAAAFACSLSPNQD